MPPVVSVEPLTRGVTSFSPHTNLYFVVVVGLAATAWLTTRHRRYRVSSNLPIGEMESGKPLITNPDEHQTPANPSPSEVPDPSSQDSHASVSDLYGTFLPPHFADIISSGAVPISSGDLAHVLSLPTSTVRRHSYPMDQDETGVSDKQTRDPEIRQDTKTRPEAELHADPLSEIQAGKQAESRTAARPEEIATEVETRSDIFRGTTAEGVMIERRDIIVKKNGTRRHVRVFEVGGGQVTAFARMGTW